MGNVTSDVIFNYNLIVLILNFIISCVITCPELTCGEGQDVNLFPPPKIKITVQKI